MSNHSNNPPTTSSSLLRLLKIWPIFPAILAIATAILIYTGNIFFSERLNGLGIGYYSVDISTYQALTQSIIAMGIISDELRSELIDLMAQPVELWIIFFILGGLAFYNFILPNNVKNKTKEIAESKTKPKWFTISGAFVTGGALFNLLIISVILFLLLSINLTRDLLSIAHQAGYKQAQKDLHRDICINRSKYKGSEKVLKTCSQFLDANGTIHYGEVLHSDDKNVIMLTNADTLVFDKSKRLYLCSNRVHIEAADKKENCFERYLKADKS